MSARRFVDYSTVTWQSDGCVDTTLAIGSRRLRLRRDRPVPIVVPERLGGRKTPYRQRQLDPDCLRASGRAYTSDESTRPYDGAGRAPGLRPASGFYFDLLTAEVDGVRRLRRDGGGPSRLVGTPVYYERRAATVDGEPGLRIDYWMLYGYGELPGRDPKQPLTVHEGDWERISVLLRPGPRRDTYVPVSVRYHRDDGSENVDWGKVKSIAAAGRQATHPVAWAARGSHALYPTPGTRRIPRRVNGETLVTWDESADCATCPEWRTWQTMLPVRHQPWYGYGGGWGLAWSSAEQSGPPGPSPHLGRQLRR